MVVAILLIGSSLSFAQCDKKVILTSTKTEHLGADSTVQRAEDERTEIVFDKTSITIKPGNEDHTMTGTITSYTCNWTTPYKNGRMVLKVSLDNPDRGDKDVTITIEGKGGKITFLGEVDGRNDRKIRLAVEKFEEKGN